MVVLGHLADALLVVGCGDDLQIGIRRKADGAGAAVAALNRETGDIQSVAGENRREHQLAFPAVIIFGNDGPDRFDLPAIGAEPLEGG